MVLCAAMMALTGCNKNDIACDTTSVQTDLINRLVSAFALESNSSESTPELLKHIKTTFENYAQDKERATKTSAQCSATVTFTDAYNSGVASTGQIHYELNKFADNEVQLDADSVRSGLNLNEFKVIKIAETPEQKSWREAQEKEKAEQAHQEEVKKAAEASKKAELEKQTASVKSAPDSDFKPVTSDQLMQLFLANSGRKVTDDEKLGVLSDRWNAEKDPFKRNDMKQEELAKANAQLSSFKDVKLIKVSKMLTRMNGRQDTVKKEIITDAYLGIYKPKDYDFASKTFPITVTGCGDSLEYGPQEIYRSRQNIKIMLEKNTVACKISPANEEEARNISGILSDIPENIFSAEGTAYLLIHGYSPDAVTINTTLIREDIAIYHRGTDALSDKAPVLKFTLK